MHNCRELAIANRSTDASSVRQNVTNCENVTICGMGPHGRGVHATAVIDGPAPSGAAGAGDAGAPPQSSAVRSSP